MGKSTSSHSGKGRVVTPATPTAKAVGVPSRKKAPAKKAPAPKKATTKKATAPKATATRKTAKGHAQVVAEMRTVAMKAGHKPPYTTPALDEALAKADTLAGKGHTLTGAKLYKGTGNMPATARDGKARREWCASVKAPLVDVADILHENKKGTEGELSSKSDRSENAVRQRVITRGKYLTGARYYAVRSEAVTGSADDQPMVYIVRV